MDPSRFIFAILLLPWHSTQAGSLTATLCSPKLPQRMQDISALFDQDDTIYLFGGMQGTFSLNHTLKYSISLDTLESAGQLPISSSIGATVMNNFGNIFHLPGGRGDPIYQYFPDTQSFTTVGNLTSPSRGSATVIPDQDTALFFGGGLSPRNAFSLNLNTLEYKSLPRIPLDFWGAGIWVEKQNAAYIFHHQPSSNVKYLRSTNQFQLLANRNPLNTRYAAVWDGRFGYLVGNNVEDPDWKNLVQFDPDTGNFTLLPVENFPALLGTAAVYVEKLNRIYMFGGFRWDPPNGYVDDMWYISLDPLDEPPTTTEDSSPITTMDPDIFNCVGRPDAVYPYPGECAKFVICRDNYGYAFDCPEPLRFHPVNRQCTFPEWVDCEQQATPEN